MWNYEKRLQYPVKITNPNPKIAQCILSQYGGPDGEMGASMRYLSQRYSMPYRKVSGLLTDIGTDAAVQKKSGKRMVDESNAELYNITLTEEKEKRCDYEIHETIWDYSGSHVPRRGVKVCHSAFDPGKHLRAGSDAACALHRHFKTGSGEGGSDISDRDHADDVYSGGRRADGFLGTDQRDLRTAYSGHVDHNGCCHGGNRTCDTVYHTKGRQGGRWTRCLVPLYSLACL